MVAHGSKRRSAAHWAYLITSFLHSGQPQKSLQAYRSMLADGLEPDLHTFLLLFKACGRTRDLEQGKTLHSHAHKRRLTSDRFVASSLLSMFGKCGSILCSEEVFHQLPEYNQDVVLWNSMLSVYAEQGHDEKVLQLYSQMRQKHLRPDHTTYAVTLRACTALAEIEEGPTLAPKHTPKRVCLEIGQAIHADARRDGLASHVMVIGSLACLYGKCGVTRHAENAFTTQAHYNVVTWTALVSAYKDQGQESKALQLYLQMHKEGIVPDEHVFSIVLQACVSLAENDEAIFMDGERIKVIPLMLGLSLHVDAARKGFMSNMFVASVLVTMYCKCGTLMRAENVFKDVFEPDLVLLTSILSAYVEQGQAAKALKLYKRMQTLGISLDATAFTCILQASGETGRLDICRQIHFDTISSGHDSNLVLEGCLVHAYGACSSLMDALVVFNSLMKPDLVSWDALIAGYTQEGNCEACMQVLEHMQATGCMPNEVTFFSILSVCSHGGHILRGIECFEAMSRDHSIGPELKHLAIVIDLFARAGNFAKAKDVVERMPPEVNLFLRSNLLGACLQHGYLELGEEVFESSGELQPQDYVLMSNIYAGASSKALYG